MDSRLNPFQDKMEKTLNNLEEEYAGIRAGRANPHILDFCSQTYADIDVQGLFEGK